MDKQTIVIFALTLMNMVKERFAIKFRWYKGNALYAAAFKKIIRHHTNFGETLGVKLILRMANFQLFRNRNM